MAELRVVEARMLDITIAMKEPSITDWSFEEIGVCDPERATRLEAAGSSDTLVVAVLSD